MIKYHERPFNLREFKVEVTHQCELNCIHCSSDARPSNTDEMPRNGCLSILSEAAAMGAKEVAFSGGEPLCWPHILDAVATARENGLSVTIYTSGNTPRYTEKTNHLGELGVDRLIFSVFGGTAASHERVTRVTGSLDRTLAAMTEAKNIGMNVEVHFVPMSTNFRELGDVVALAKAHGASVVSVLRLVPQGRAALLVGRTLNRVQNLELRRQIQVLRHRGYRIRTGSPYNFLMLTDSPKCAAAIDRVIIGPDFHLYPCDAFKQVEAGEVLGTEDLSLLNGIGLKECWDHSPYLEAVRRYLTTPFQSPCNSCGQLEKCVSGCLAQKVIAHGNFDKHPDPDCLQADSQEDRI
ncbi:MAG: radical SAM/SPASM domain-containing protein [Desulfomonilaceae bacterium]